MYSLHCIVFCVNLCIFLNCSVYTVHCMIRMYDRWYLIRRILYVGPSVHDTMCLPSIHCTSNCVRCTLYGVHCMLGTHIVWYTLCPTYILCTSNTRLVQRYRAVPVWSRRRKGELSLTPTLGRTLAEITTCSMTGVRDGPEAIGRNTHLGTYNVHNIPEHHTTSDTIKRNIPATR